MTNSLLPIFYSQFSASPNWNILDELDYCIYKKLLQIEIEKIANIEQFYKEFEKSHITDGLGPQGKGHTILKVLSQKWLTKAGKTSKTEVFYAGLHPDVISNDHAIILECGNTDPACMPIYLSYIEVAFVGIIPFPSSDNLDINIYKFIKNESYLSYLKYKKLSLRENIKKFSRNR